MNNFFNLYISAIKFYLNFLFFSYRNGDIYEGFFKDGLPHGYGIKKEGHFMTSAASVYIGEWYEGLKQGYGVIDEIQTGN